MEWRFHTHLVLSAVAVPITMAVTYAAWKRRRTPVILSFFLLMLVCSVWAVSSFLTSVAPSEPLAVFFELRLRMAAVSLLPVFFLLFALDYSGYRTWLRPGRLALLLAVPLVTQILLWTPLHPLFIEATELHRLGSFLVRQRARFGPWFPVHRAYSYALVAASLVVLLLQIMRSSHFYRRQAMILFFGMVFVVGANAVANLTIPAHDGSPTTWLDWTVPAFTVSGVAWGWALFRAGLLDVMPVALDAVFGSMNDAVLVLNHEDRLVDLNPAGTRLIGVARTHAIGARLSEVAPDLSALASRGENSEQRAEITVADRVLEVRLSPLQEARGRRVGRLAVLRDITERAQMIKDLDAYARTVAHDLKDPLSVILGYVEVARSREGAIDEQAAGYLKRASETGEQMAGIINELLLLASVRSSEQVSTGALDMARIVHQATQRLAPQIERTGAAIVLPSGWPAARGYAAWVEEIWANYVSNALKYGEHPLRIELGAEPAGAAARFWVHNNGPGLTAEARTRLFREHSRLDPEQATGHGLGLAIVLRIAKKLGGNAGVDSEPGQGTRFWFTLPQA